MAMVETLHEAPVRAADLEAAPVEDTPVTGGKENMMLSSRMRPRLRLGVPIAVFFISSYITLEITTNYLHKPTMTTRELPPALCPYFLRGWGGNL